MLLLWPIYCNILPCLFCLFCLGGGLFCPTDYLRPHGSLEEEKRLGQRWPLAVGLGEEWTGPPHCPGSTGCLQRSGGIDRAPPRQNRQNRQGNILQYIGNSNSNKANCVKYFLFLSLYICLTDIGLFLGTLWHVHAMVFNMSSIFHHLLTFTRCF